MANIKSAKKRILQNARRAEINKFRLSRIRTGIKNFNSSISGQKRKIFQENIFWYWNLKFQEPHLRVLLRKILPLEWFQSCQKN